REIDHRFKEIDRRFEEIDKRFEEIDKRFRDIDERFKEMERRFESLEKRASGVEERIARLENSLRQFSEVLIGSLEVKGVFTSTEATALKNLVKALIPIPSSKYYTREVYERLKRLLDKDSNEYTMADIYELEEIADLIEKEGYESKRRELIDYAWKLRYFAMVAKVVFIYPKLRKLAEQGKNMITPS
ncbi:MAG: hypothetical protein QXG81_07595, partial [Ignisphaera sp.]